MAKPQAKKCPQCGTITGLDDPVCANCHHHFRTRFDPKDPQPSDRPIATPLVPTAADPLPRTQLILLAGLQKAIEQRTRHQMDPRLFSALVIVLGTALLTMVGVLLYASGTRYFH